MIKFLPLVVLLSGCSMIEINIYEPCIHEEHWCRWGEPPGYARGYTSDLGKGGFKIQE